MEKFFATPQISGCSEQSDRIMLLSGPPSCGKTSLLFQFSFNAALEFNRHVVFICKRSRIDGKPPFISQGVDPSSDIFQRIKMKYVDDEEALRRFFAAFHLHDSFPAAVVIDDFGDFFNERKLVERYGNSRGVDIETAKILALSFNAIVHSSKIQQCSLLLSDTHHGDTPRLFYIFKRWIPSIFTIKGVLRIQVFSIIQVFPQSVVEAENPAMSIIILRCFSLVNKVTKLDFSYLRKLHLLTVALLEVKKLPNIL